MPKPTNKGSKAQTFELSPDQAKAVKMKKRIFGLVALAFVVVVFFLTYDILNRTTMPGKKKHLPTSITPE
jgi:hypothetical protein